MTVDKTADTATVGTAVESAQKQLKSATDCLIEMTVDETADTLAVRSADKTAVK